MRKLIPANAAVALVTLTWAAPVVAEDTQTATLTLKSWKVAFIGSVGYCQGVLNYQGKTRKFTMKGLGIGGIGLSTADATGIVYNMKSMDDFVGSYTSARTGLTLGKDEFIKDRMLWLKNEKGVKIKLTTKKAGIELNLGADGTVAKWAD